jgi:hypothetical protein
MPVSSAVLTKLTEVAALGGAANRQRLVNFLKVSFALLFAEVAASTAITGATESATAFDQYYTVKANSPEAGSVVRGKAWGKHTATTGSENHTLALLLGTTALYTSGNLDPANDDYWTFEWEIIYRTVGASGTFVASGTLSYGASGAAGTVLRWFKDSTAVDTTADNTITVVIDRQGTATDSDSVRQDSMVVFSAG